MGEKSAIAWTEATWNPWHGCLKVSAGCKFCYMYREKERYGQDPTKVVRSKTTFRNPLKWSDPRMIFACSWSDWFIREADAWRPEAWEIVRWTPRHTYQILTKRPERIMANLPTGWSEGFQHVWLGVSIENKDTLHRLDTLRAIPAAIRFVSFEPLLEDLGKIDLRGIHWAIWGGESGPKARMLSINWILDGMEQARFHGTKNFVKQLGREYYRDDEWGARHHIWLQDPKGGDPSEWEPALRVREFPEARG